MNISPFYLFLALLGEAVAAVTCPIGPVRVVRPAGKSQITDANHRRVGHDSVEGEGKVFDIADDNFKAPANKYLIQNWLLLVVNQGPEAALSVLINRNIREL